jgi:serine/threonine protein kinase
MNLSEAESPEDIQRVYSEIQLLRELNHPNIVNLIDAF